MSTVNTTLIIPKEIAQGLMNETLTRIGGVVRDANTGKIVAFLKETASAGNLMPSNLVIGALNLGASILNLGVSVIGFSVVLNRLKTIEGELKSTKEILLKSNERIGQKIDLSFYANFAAALTLAENAFRMKDSENRRISAMQAINRFLEAEGIYSNSAKEILAANARGSEQYLLTLALAYIAEIRCYLELEEKDTAYQRQQEAIAAFRPLVESYIKTLLTSKPCVYLHPELKDEIDLVRVTKIVRWVERDDTISESECFQRYRSDIHTLYREEKEWKSSLPSAVWAHIESKDFPAIFKQLPILMEKMESMIETFQRLESYGAEVQMIQQLEMSFREWTQLTALPEEAAEAEIICILPSS